MSTTDLIRHVLLFLVVTFASCGLGFSVLHIFKHSLIKQAKSKKQLSLEMLGAALLIGLGIVGYATLLLGAFTAIRGNYTYPLLFIFIAFSHKHLKKMFANIPKLLKENLVSFLKNPLILLIMVLSLGIYLSLYLKSLEPPNVADELHYHFPEIQSFIDNGIHVLFSGHNFYISIPKLDELLLAFGTSLLDYSFARSLNFAFLTGFLLVVFGIVKKFYTQRAAALSILMILLFEDFTHNATSGYVDSVAVGLEIASLLFLISWTFEKKEKVNFYFSSILLGLAVSVKYSPLPTVLFSLALVFIYSKSNIKTRIISVINYSVPSFIFGGFWYLKNLFLYLNPFYPLYFGHEGIPNATYKNLVATIQQFKPKTAKSFFKLIGHYKNFKSFTVYLSFYLAPITVFIKKRKVFHFILLVYYITYTLYWFFIATHQTRFLAPAIISATILTAIFLDKLAYKAKSTYLALGVLAVFLFGVFVLHLPYKTIWNNYWYAHLHVNQRQYALGNIALDEFLIRHFGCQYQVIKFLQNNGLQGGVIDNWSVWFAPSVSFYAKNNTFQTYGVDPSLDEKEVLAKTFKTSLKYIYFDTQVKEKHLNSKSYAALNSKEPKEYAENILLKHSKLIYTEKTCRLYKINSD